MEMPTRTVTYLRRIRRIDSGQIAIVVHSAPAATTTSGRGIRPVSASTPWTMTVSSYTPQPISWKTLARLGSQDRRVADRPPRTAPAPGPGRGPAPAAPAGATPAATAACPD